MGLTCKKWRTLILHTPAAWHLDKLHLIPADHVGAWIARSRDYRRISLIVPATATYPWISAIMRYRGQIERLRLHGHLALLALDFPMVKSLELFEGDGAHGPIRSRIMTYISATTPTSYPFLQSLYIYSNPAWSPSLIPIRTPIPVTTLFLESDRIDYWIGLLLACAPTVVVLTVKILHGHIPIVRPPTISFPNLVALTLSGDQLPLDLTTPRVAFLQLRDCHHRVLSSVDGHKISAGNLLRAAGKGRGPS
jgi:hypothetical protein